MTKKGKYTLKLNTTQGTKASKSKEYEKELKRSSQRIMKVVQLEDELLQPTTSRIKKVTELEEDLPNVATSIMEEY